MKIFLTEFIFEEITRISLTSVTETLVPGEKNIMIFLNKKLNSTRDSTKY